MNAQSTLVRSILLIFDEQVVIGHNHGHNYNTYVRTYVTFSIVHVFKNRSTLFVRNVLSIHACIPLIS